MNGPFQGLQPLRALRASSARVCVCACVRVSVWSAGVYVCEVCGYVRMCAVAPPTMVLCVLWDTHAVVSFPQVLQRQGRRREELVGDAGHVPARHRRLHKRHGLARRRAQPVSRVSQSVRQQQKSASERARERKSERGSDGVRAHARTTRTREVNKTNRDTNARTTNAKEARNLRRRAGGRPLSPAPPPPPPLCFSSSSSRRCPNVMPWLPSAIVSASY